MNNIKPSHVEQHIARLEEKVEMMQILIDKLYQEINSLFSNKYTETQKQLVLSKSELIKYITKKE